MSSYKIVKLKFISPLHIGKGLGDHYDSAGNLLHSDKVSGAIASAYCHLKGDSKIVSFINSYKVSSAFPFKGECHYFPKPLANLNFEIEGGNSYEKNKKLKKIEFIDFRLFSYQALGNKSAIKLEQFSNDNKFLSFEGKLSAPYIDEIEQRVVVPRTGGDATPFYFERRFFSSDSGLYFIYEVEDKYLSDFQNSVRWLGNSGFGTDKSVGNGQFEPEFTKIEINETEDTNCLLTLSLYCPEKSEIESGILNNSFYSLVQRGGFIAGTTNDRFRHLRKKSIYMFAEGSIFKTDQLIGKICDVKPDWNEDNLHPVYRDGRAIYLPIKI